MIKPNRYICKHYYGTENYKKSDDNIENIKIDFVGLAIRGSCRIYYVVFLIWVQWQGKITNAPLFYAIFYQEDAIYQNNPLKPGEVL